MKFYATFAAIFVALSILLGVFVCVPVERLSLLSVILYWVGSLAAVAAIDTLSMFSIYAMPGKFFMPSKALFKTGKRDQKLFEVLGYDRFEGKLMRDIELFTLFKKDKSKKGTDTTSLLNEMVVTCKTEVSRYAIVVLSILILLIFPKQAFLYCTLPLVVGNLLLAVLSFFTARYDRIKLQKAYQKQIKI